MSPPHEFRFTIGQWMAAIAFFAVLTAAAISERQITGSGAFSMFSDPRYLLATAIRFAGVGVCLYNLPLSRGMWLVIAGYLGPWLVGIATGLLIAGWYSAPNNLYPVLVARVGWAVSLLFSLVFVAGLAVTFRDIRRRLSNLEGFQG